MTAKRPRTIRDVLGAAQPYPIDSLHRTDDHQAIRHKERRGRCSFLRQQLERSALPSIDPRIAFSDQGRVERHSVGCERLPIAGQSLFCGSDTGETRHDANPPVPKRDQMLDRLSSAPHVVYEDSIDAQFGRETVNAHQWQPLRRPGA
jgi:hypothetical protein